MHCIEVPYIESIFPKFHFISFCKLSAVVEFQLFADNKQRHGAKKENRNLPGFFRDEGGGVWGRGRFQFGLVCSLFSWQHFVENFA